MGIKKVCIFFLIICFLLVSLVNVSCFLFGSAEEPELVPVARDQEEESTGAEEGPEVLMENEDFMDVLSSFDYEGSTVEEAKQVSDDEYLFFILLESTEGFEVVEDYYKDMKVKSIWIRSEIFEKSPEYMEEEFISSDDESVPVSKFTYSNLEKDKVVNVLIKGLEESRTQIMIIYWNLQ